MLEIMIEMAKVRRVFVCGFYRYGKKTYDRVIRKKLFEVLSGYGVQ